MALVFHKYTYHPRPDVLLFSWKSCFQGFMVMGSRKFTFSWYGELKFFGICPFFVVTSSGKVYQYWKKLTSEPNPSLVSFYLGGNHCYGINTYTCTFQVGYPIIGNLGLRTSVLSPTFSVSLALRDYIAGAVVSHRCTLTRRPTSLFFCRSGLVWL